MKVKIHGNDITIDLTAKETSRIERLCAEVGLSLEELIIHILKRVTSTGGSGECLVKLT